MLAQIARSGASRWCVLAAMSTAAAGECKCIFPASRRILYRPNRCGANSTRCKSDRDHINQCALCLGHSSVISRRRHGRQAKLIDALLAAPLAIVGDSMSRQAFITLITRLRGPDLPVVDFNLHGAVKYKLFMAPMPPGSWSYARVADGYNLPHLPLDWLAPPNASGGAPNTAMADASAKRPTRSVFDWAAERVLSDWRRNWRPPTAASSDSTSASSELAASYAPAAPLPHVQSTSVGFYWAPCTYMLLDAAKEVHPTLLKPTAPAPPWQRVVYFAPAYWHLTGACGAKHILNATSEAVLRVWKPLLNLSNASLLYTVVTAPTENVPTSAKAAHQRKLNALLRAQFAAGAFPPNWSLLDWAALTDRTPPYPTVVPFGDQKHSWHYACQFYRNHAWYTLSTHHNVSLMTKVGSGDCDEEANTLLWTELLLRNTPVRAAPRR